MALTTDQRTRIQVKGNYTAPFQGPGAPLRTTNGIIFPYTPVINLSQSVEYAPYEIIHANYQQNAFVKGKNPTITIQGQFTATTPNEGQYMMGVIHFLRVVTKMNFGQNDNMAGTPPPVLLFKSHGKYNFHNVPVLVSDFTVPYENQTDYIEIDINGEKVHMPTIMNLSVTLMPHYSPRVQNNFNLNEFANGNLYSRGYI